MLYLKFGSQWPCYLAPTGPSLPVASVGLPQDNSNLEGNISLGLDIPCHGPGYVTVRQPLAVVFSKIPFTPGWSVI